MRPTGILLLTLSAFAATVVLAVLPSEGAGVWFYAAVAVTAFLLVWLWISVARPVSMAEKGMELLMSREWNSRLARVGEPGADRIVRLYNSLLSRLSEESRKLRERDHFLDLLIEASPTGIAMMDFDGHITLANGSFLRLAGAASRDAVSGKTLGELDGELMRLVAAMNPGETSVLRISDMQVYRCRRLWFMERGFRKPFVMIDSLTDEVRKAEKDAYGKIVRTISHELNNSIGGVNTFLDVLVGSDGLDADFREVAASCRERNESLSRFVKGYTDIVRLPAPELAPLDLNAMLRDMEPFLQVMGRGRVEVRQVLCADGLPVRGDIVMLQQVVVNIVKNGVESISGDSDQVTDLFEGETGMAGIVEIRTRRERGGVALEIADTGRGIPDGVAGKIFTPFFSTKSSGQGLGLTFAAEVLEGHGCRFSLCPLPAAAFPFTVSFTVRFPK